MTDGGVIALVGFFYQLSGSAAGLAKANIDTHAVILLEPGGEDALISSLGNDKLIQFKYSKSADTITPGMFAEILQKLEKHSKDNQTAWELVTNRPLSPAVQHLVVGGDPQSSILSSVAPANKKLIERLHARLKVLHQNFSVFETTLRNYGRYFGLRDAEIAGGADRIIGAMLRLIVEQGANAVLSLNHLNELLVGFSGPGRLRGLDRADELAIKLDQIATAELSGPSLNDTQLRKALNDLCDGPEPVVVIGPGGCGKTTAVLRTIRDHVIQNNVLGAMLFAHSDDTLDTVVAQWRSPNHYLPPESPVLAMERLSIANTTNSLTGSILVLGLDGIDEIGWVARHTHVRNLMNWASNGSALTNANRIKVILTCRNDYEVDDLLIRTGVSETLGPEPFKVVRLDVFDDEEFQQAWSRWIGNLPLPRAVSVRGLAESIDNESRPVNSNDQQIITALKHPTMFMCFRRLGLTNDIKQRELLDGEPGAWHELIDGYLVWFCKKTMARSGTATSQVLEVLKAVAWESLTNPVARFSLDDHWIRPAVTTVGMEPAKAKRIFEDAVTSGLLLTTAGRFKVPKRMPVQWKWCYDFVPEHLCSQH